MDEQVVPSFAPAGVRRTGSAVRGLNRVGVVPVARPEPVPVPVPAEAAQSPSLEYAGNRRWETPLRAGKWKERWEGARELGLGAGVRGAVAGGVAMVVRGSVAEFVVAYVGDVLPRATVEKWLCLLCEYLELNADEQVLLVCLLRRYVECGGKFVGQGDWARPQRWECVVAIACYLSVLLSEEFPGRTAMDLRELLGANFRFGVEQVAFLRAVNWRICIATDYFEEVKEACEGILKGNPESREALRGWFKVDQAIADRKVREANAAAASAAALAAAAATAVPMKTSPVIPTYAAETPVVGKKRGFAAVATADDSVVPRVVVPRYGAYAAVVPSAVPQWGAQW